MACKTVRRRGILRKYRMNNICSEQKSGKCETTIKGDTIMKDASQDDFLGRTIAILESVEMARAASLKSQEMAEKEFKEIAEYDPILAALLREADDTADRYREAIRKHILRRTELAARRPN